MIIFFNTQASHQMTIFMAENHQMALMNSPIPEHENPAGNYKNTNICAKFKKVDMNPESEKKVTFLRQHDLDQVPGVETKNSFLSADVYRLPQSTNAYCTGDLNVIMV